MAQDVQDRIKPFAAYVADEEIAPIVEPQFDGIYDRQTQQWEYLWIRPESKDCGGKTNTQTRLTSSRMTGNPPGIDATYDHGDTD